MTGRALYYLAIFTLAIAVYLLVTVRSAATDEPTSTLPLPPYRPPILESVETAARRDVEVRKLRHKLAVERRRLAEMKRRHRALVRTLLRRPTVVEAINLACATYGSCGALWRRARCESGYSPSAYNDSGASGLFQFLPSTFASTPYRSFSIWSAYANALAAGWMHAHGRGGEWECR